MNPKVSIILLTYNQIDYIDEAINSIIEQTYENWELIVSDNGSDDGTHEILRKYENNKRIKLLIYDSNDYVTKRANQALKEVSGEYISLFYGDDYFLPNKIEEQVDCFNKLSKEWGVVHGPGYSLNQFTKVRTIESFLDVHGEALPEILKYFYVKGYISPIAPLTRRECYEKYPFYDDLFTEGESIYMKFSLSYKFFYLDKPLDVMRVYDSNARWFSKRNIEIQDKCLERLKSFEEFPTNCLDDLSKLRSKNYSVGAWENIRLSQNMDRNYIRGRIYKAFKQEAILSISLKNLIAFSLTLVPNFIRKGFNFVLDFLFVRKRPIYFDESFVKKHQD